MPKLSGIEWVTLKNETANSPIERETSSSNSIILIFSLILCSSNLFLINAAASLEA